MNSISIVIPVYNEEDRIADCLQAISRLRPAPLEVIVVDNNSTDNSVLVAKRFDFVKLIKEPRQGVAYARSRGFDAAKGSIIARIDADTVVPPNWLRIMENAFNESDTDAISGSFYYHDIAGEKTFNLAENSGRRWLAKHMQRCMFLNGSNMALRRSAWRKIRLQLCATSDLHEDLDLAIHLQQHGLAVSYLHQLRVNVSARRFDTTFDELAAYLLLNTRTYQIHKAPSYKYMYPLLYATLACQPLIRIMYRLRNIQTVDWSWQSILAAPTAARPNPATFK